MRVSWESIKSFDIYNQSMETYSIGILISNLASGILGSMIWDIPLSLSLFTFSMTAAMGTTVVFLYSFIIRDLEAN